MREGLQVALESGGQTKKGGGCPRRNLGLDRGNGAPRALTCCSGSKAANRVAFAQGLRAQGLRAALGGPRCPFRLGLAAASVPVIEPQHVLRHLVVRGQYGARATTCHAVAWHSLVELREILLQSLSPRQAHAEAAQPQIEQPARPSHSELPAPRVRSPRGEGTLRGREGPATERSVELRISGGEGAGSARRCLSRTPTSRTFCAG